MLRRVAFASIAMLVVGTSSLLCAQAPKGTPVQFKSGTLIKQVLPSQGLLVEMDGKQYGVGFNAESKVSLEGVSGPEFLTPGTYVQFDVALDEKGNPTQEVKKIQITVKDNINIPGIFSSKGPDGKPGEAGDYFVRGNVKTNKNNELSVTAGGKSMTVKLAAGLTVPVTIARWQLAKPGDAIQGTGESYPVQGQPMIPVLGKQVVIKAVAPIDSNAKVKGK